MFSIVQNETIFNTISIYHSRLGMSSNQKSFLHFKLFKNQDSRQSDLILELHLSEWV